MASIIKIKNSTGSVPPTGLTFGEPAFVQGTGLTANRLYMGNSTSTSIWVGAEISTTGTWTDNAAKTSLATQYATDQRIATQISGSGVSSFNGTTGAVTGVGSAVAGTGISVSGATGAVTITNTGVQTFNGLTGAVGGVTTSVANTFTAAQTFTAGITVSGSNLNAVNINTTGSVSINNNPATLTTTTAGNATVFNSVATSLGIGGAATGITIGAATGTINIRNPTIIVGNTVATITTASGTGNTLTVSPYGDFKISPTSTTSNGGDRTSLIVTNPDDALGTVLIRGGDLYLGTKTSALPSTTPVNIVFEGATDNGFETTLTVTDPATADRTITLPDATGTVALTTTSVASAVAGTGISVSGATGAVTITNIGVQTFNGLTGAVTGLTSGGPLGTPSSGTLTNCTSLPVATGISGLCGGIATFLAQPTSANLITAMSDETGTGLLVFGTNPVLTTPNLGTPTTLVGTNITGTATGFTVGSASLATNSLSLGGTAASGWAQLASPTFTGTVNTNNLIVGGDLTVSGTTTTINSTTLTINDFNIIVGATLSGTGATGAAIATGAGIAVGTGTGISFAYEHSSTSWLSTMDLNVLSGKTYKIAGTSVLSSTTLGSSVVTSSLTSVGTLTTFVIDAGTF